MCVELDDDEERRGIRTHFRAFSDRGQNKRVQDVPEDLNREEAPGLWEARTLEVQFVRPECTAVRYSSKSSVSKSESTTPSVFTGVKPDLAAFNTVDGAMNTLLRSELNASWTSRYELKVSSGGSRFTTNQ